MEEILLFVYLLIRITFNYSFLPYLLHPSESNPPKDKVDKRSIMSSPNTLTSFTFTGNHGKFLELGIHSMFLCFPLCDGTKKKKNSSQLSNNKISQHPNVLVLTVHVSKV